MEFIDSVDEALMAGFNCRSCCCPCFVILWCVLLGPLMILCHMFCCHYPSAESHIL